MQNNGIAPLSYTINKNKLKVNQRFKCETLNSTTPRNKHRENVDIGLGNDLFELTSKAQAPRAKINKLDIKLKFSAQQRKQSTI